MNRFQLYIGNELLADVTIKEHQLDFLFQTE